MKRVPILLAVLLLCTTAARASTTASITVNGVEKGTDSSTITIAFNGFAESVHYDSTSSARSIASAFAAKFSKDYVGAGVCASAKGNVITVQLKTGSFTPISVSGSNASFQFAASGFPNASSPLSGTVYAGQAPIVGAHVYLFAANTTGYGQASVPLLNAANTGYQDSVGPYVLTDANGNFSMTGDYSCTAAQQVYVYALGGDSGHGANPLAGLVAAVGSCPAATVSVVLNEVTTVATVYALAGFMTDATHVSSSGSAMAQTGVANAFATVTNLVSGGSALAVTPAGNGTVPQKEINTLADILATCVDTNGGSGCSNLFGMVMPSGGAYPQDTVQAALDIAQYPAKQASGLAGLASASSPFQPILLGTPDWTIGVSYPLGTPNPQTLAIAAMAIDGLGQVWLVNSPAASSTLIKLSNLGVVLSGSSGYSMPGFVTSLAIDPAGSVWVTNGNGTYSWVNKVSSTGSVLSTYLNTGVGNPYSLAIDGAGNVWVGSYNAAGLFKLSNDGTDLSSGGFGTGTQKYLLSLAIDDAGDVWAQINGAGVLEYNSSGTSLSGLSGYPTGTGPVAIDASGSEWSYSGNNSLYKHSSTGGLLSPASGFPTCDPTAASPYFCFGFFPGVAEPISVTIDGLGNVWSPVIYYGPGTRQYANGITEVSNSGTILSGNHGYATSGAEGYYPSLLRVDSSGNLWGASLVSVTEYIGVAAPVVTPLSVAVQNGLVGMRP